MDGVLCYQPGYPGYQRCPIYISPHLVSQGPGNANANYPTNTDPDCIDRQQIMNDPVLGRVWREMGKVSTINSLLARYIKGLYM